MCEGKKPFLLCSPDLCFLISCADENEKGESALSQYREQATVSSGLAARLSEEVSKLTADRDDLKRQICVARYLPVTMMNLCFFSLYSSCCKCIDVTATAQTCGRDDIFYKQKTVN